jgi:hypothetical protein
MYFVNSMKCSHATDKSSVWYITDKVDVKISKIWRRNINWSRREPHYPYQLEMHSSETTGCSLDYLNWTVQFSVNYICKKYVLIITLSWKTENIRCYSVFVKTNCTLTLATPNYICFLNIITAHAGPSA